MEPFELHCLDVGQGSSTVLILSGTSAEEREALVIDSADGIATIDCLRSRSVNRLRLVLITHSDDDHMKGIPLVLQEYAGRISAIAFNIDRSTINDKDTQVALLDALSASGASGKYRTVDDVEHADARSAAVAELLTHDGTKYGEILHPFPEDVLWASSHDRPNHASAIVSLWIGDYRVLLGSDLGPVGWSILCHRILPD